MNKIIAFCTIFAVLFGCVLCRIPEEEQSIKLHFYDGSSKWWIAVDPRDDSFETIKIELQEASSNQWTPMMYEKGWPYFHLPSTSGRGFALPLSFRLSSENEETIALVYRIGSNLLVDTMVQYNNSIIEVPTEPATPAPTEPSTVAPTTTPSPTVPSTVAPTEAATPAPTQPATPAPTQPATPAPTRPATVAPTQPATLAPTQPATPAPTQPATLAPTQPATVAPTRPATPAPTQPATVAPTQPATPAPTQPATVAPTQPATPAPTRPATPAPTQPATAAPTIPPPTAAPTTRPTRPATVAPTQPATPAPTRPATPAPTQPATPAPTQPATPAPTQPATSAPTRPATPAPTQPATQAPTRPATPAPTQPATPAPTQPATPAPTQPATPAPTPKATPAPTQPPASSCSLVSTKVEPLKILIPLYVYPGASWDTIIAAANTGVKIIAIINPNSGPRYDGPDANYIRYMKKFQDAGIEMVGYVHTSWGARSISTVNNEIGIYASKYPGVTGIFFDEAATEGTKTIIDYYTTAYNTVLSKNFVHSILNPGTQPDQQYLKISSNIVIFENYASEMQRAGYSNWVKCNSNDFSKSEYKYKFSAIIHTANQNDMNALIKKTHDLGMGLIYITDGPGGCCTYNWLNVYFTAQAAAVKSFNSNN